jgi:hypothetical protein
LASSRLCASELEQPVAQTDEIAAADAPATEPDFTTRRFVLQLRTGLATSVGFVGALGEFNLHDRLAINAGVGTNFYGLSSAVGLRLRPIIFSSSIGTTHGAAYAITLEGSLSRAAFGEQPRLDLSYCLEECPSPSPRLQTRYVSWGQLELGVEMRAAERYQFLGSLGWSKMLGSPTFTCVSDATGERRNCADDDTRITRRVFVITFAVGYAF